MKHLKLNAQTASSTIPASLSLLSRDRLIRRWRHGSDSFFWRAEADGLLLPVRRPDRRAVAYRWADVFRFEGGMPPTDWNAAYRCDLLLPEEVAEGISRKREWVCAAARAGDLPHRRVGLQFRFVPAEVTLFLGAWI